MGLPLPTEWPEQATVPLASFRKNAEHSRQPLEKFIPGIEPTAKNLLEVCNTEMKGNRALVQDFRLLPVNCPTVLPHPHCTANQPLTSSALSAPAHKRTTHTHELRCAAWILSIGSQG